MLGVRDDIMEPYVKCEPCPTYWLRSWSCRLKSFAMVTCLSRFSGACGLRRMEIITTSDYVGALMELSQQRRGEFVDMQYLTPKRTTLVYNMPLAEVTESREFTGYH